MVDKLPTTIIKSPDQASTIYGLESNSVPRKKSLFYVRFVGNLGNLPDWQSNLGFVVKTIDRPLVQVQLEELHQYNKKRKIVTGYKIPNIKISLYDTVDCLVMKMWNEYSKYYFGDFNQGDESNFQYDVTTNQMLDNGSGFGYVLPQSASSSDAPIDINSQFFFRKIEVYQLFNNKYIQYDLINPKIETFDPGDLDYEQSSPSVINLSIAYEALIYRNNNEPKSISGNSDVQSAFNNQFNGNTPNVSAPIRLNGFKSTPDISSMQDTYNSISTNLTNNIQLMSVATTTAGTGALSMYGDYDFGETTGIARAAGPEFYADMAYIRAEVPYLDSTMNLSMAPIYNSVGKSITKPTNSSGISGPSYDATIGNLSAQGNQNNNASADSYLNKKVVGGVMSSGIINKTSPLDQIKKVIGLSLNSQSYALVNSQQSSTTQIGTNNGNTNTGRIQNADGSSTQISGAPLTQKQISEFNATITGGT